MARARAGHGGAAARGGAVAGLFAGAIMAIWVIVSALLSNGDVWRALKGAATPFLRARAARPGFDGEAVALGVLSHFAVSIVWGILFGLLFFGLSKGATIVASLVWGIVVWFGMFYVVLPLVGMGNVAASMPAAVAIGQHMLFGLAIGVGFLPFQRPMPMPRGGGRVGPRRGARVVP